MEELASLSVNEEENEEEVDAKIKQEKNEQLKIGDLTSIPNS